VTGTHQEYKGYNWKNTNWARVAELLPAPEEVNIQDEQNFNHLCHLILRALRISTPTRQVTKWSRPWWNPYLAEMRRIKNTTFRDFRAGRTDKHTYHRTRNAYLQAIWKATQDHWNTVVENTNPSSLWQTVRKVLSKPPVLLATINGATSFEDKAQVLRQAFFPENGPPPQHQPSDSLEGFHLVTQEEVRKALEAIPPKSTPGDNTLPPSVWIRLHKIHPDILINMTDWSLCSRTLPAILK